MIESSLLAVSQHPDYQVLKRVPVTLAERVCTDAKTFAVTIASQHLNTGYCLANTSPLVDRKLLPHQW